MATGVQKGRRFVRHRSINGFCNDLERRHRRTVKAALREATRGNFASLDKVEPKPISVEYWVW